MRVSSAVNIYYRIILQFKFKQLSIGQWKDTVQLRILQYLEEPFKLLDLIVLIKRE